MGLSNLLQMKKDFMEASGFEPGSSAWQSDALPLGYHFLPETETLLLLYILPLPLPHYIIELFPPFIRISLVPVAVVVVRYIVEVESQF